MNLYSRNDKKFSLSNEFLFKQIKINLNYLIIMWLFKLKETDFLLFNNE